MKTKGRQGRSSASSEVHFRNWGKGRRFAESPTQLRPACSLSQCVAGGGVGRENLLRLYDCKHQGVFMEKICSWKRSQSGRLLQPFWEWCSFTLSHHWTQLTSLALSLTSTIAPWRNSGQRRVEVTWSTPCLTLMSTGGIGITGLTPTAITWQAYNLFNSL